MYRVWEAEREKEREGERERESGSGREREREREREGNSVGVYRLRSSWHVLTASSSDMKGARYGHTW